MEFITPQILIGLLLISIGIVSKFDIKFEFLREKEWITYANSLKFFIYLMKKIIYIMKNQF